MIFVSPGWGFRSNWTKTNVKERVPTVDGRGVTQECSMPPRHETLQNRLRVRQDLPSYSQFGMRTTAGFVGSLALSHIAIPGKESVS